MKYCSKAKRMSQEAARLLNKRVLDTLYRRLLVEVRGHDPKVLESYATFVQMVSKNLNLNLNSINTPERFIERWTLLKSRFSNRKHLRQYEIRTHFKEIEFINLTGSTADTLLEYIQRNLPEGVSMHVTRQKALTLDEILHDADAGDATTSADQKKSA